MKQYNSTFKLYTELCGKITVMKSGKRLRTEGRAAFGKDFLMQGREMLLCSERRIAREEMNTHMGHRRQEQGLPIPMPLEKSVLSMLPLQIQRLNRCETRSESTCFSNLSRQYR